MEEQPTIQIGIPCTFGHFGNSFYSRFVVCLLAWRHYGRETSSIDGGLHSKILAKALHIIKDGWRLQKVCAMHEEPVGHNDCSWVYFFCAKFVNYFLNKYYRCTICKGVYCALCLNFSKKTVCSCPKVYKDSISLSERPMVWNGWKSCLL
jgi:hypothetical protein